MPDEPPCEWVDGDPVRAGQYAYIVGAFTSITCVILAILLLNMLAQFGVGSLPGLPSSIVLPASIACLWAMLLFVFLFPRATPVVARIGLSAKGLHIAAPFGSRFTRKWGSIERLGPDWVEVSWLKRYRLTSQQAARLHQFLQPR